jgi:uncharacterized RDD family membrane protein YckC
VVVPSSLPSTTCNRLLHHRRVGITPPGAVTDGTRRFTRYGRRTMATRGGPPATGIVTPEAVRLEFETAGVASRVIADLIDLTSQLVLLLASFFALGAISGAIDAQALLVVAAFVISFLVIFGYPVALETLWNGRSLGKAALGLRVVTREGAPVRFRHAAIRAMIGLIEIWALFGLPAAVSIIASRRDQRLGDLVAGTLVLRQRAGRRPSAPVVFSVPWNWEPWVATLDVAGLTPEQYGVVRAFLLRAGELTPEARWQVAAELGSMVSGRMAVPVPPSVHPEMFLTCVASAYQRRFNAASGVGGAAPVPPATAGYPGLA